MKSGQTYRQTDRQTAYAFIYIDYGHRVTFGLFNLKHHAVGLYMYEDNASNFHLFPNSRKARQIILMISDVIRIIQKNRESIHSVIKR